MFSTMDRKNIMFFTMELTEHADAFYKTDIESYLDI